MIAQRRMIGFCKMIADAGILVTAFWFAFLVRFEGAIPDPFLRVMLLYLPFALATKLLILGVAGEFKASWRYTGLRETIRIWCCLALGAIPLLICRQLRDVGAEWLRILPVGVILLDIVLSFLGLLAARTLVRVASERIERRKGTRSPSRRVPTLLIGAGSAGALVAKEILARPDTGIHLVGFLDDDESLRGLHIMGRPVLGTTADLQRVLERHDVGQAIITIARAPAVAIRRIARLCEANGLATRIIPPLHELVENGISLSKIRDVSIEDLLRRSPVQLDVGEVAEIVTGHCVMVTGAGGSIGSELCRIIALLRPARLVLVDQAEPNLFHIHSQLAEQHAEIEIVPCIADICDEARMDAIFADYRPRLVLHAAAHKHVPMMEWNPGEAVKNNVVGTRTIATLAAAWEVQRFVMISTDKAVNPTSVMGVSKRVAELVIQGLAQESSTRFMTVRFGNVLGSTGSVIPIFQRQIARGGPVTVTHPEMKRYFMTIPEACQLVLQAAAMGKGGELFILDMGEPVKIVDLARDLIRLSGLRPDEDVEIHFTGLRPGEKLFEELSLGEEEALKTKHPRIFIGKVRVPELDWINRVVDDLHTLALGCEVIDIHRKFKEIVPEYQSGVLRQEDAGSPAPLHGPHQAGTASFSS
jgi:FlaA1/EpsC-like NDP-sugar epimerase